MTDVNTDGYGKAGMHEPVALPPPASAVPLGLLAFGTTTFVLSCYNAGIWGVQATSPPNVVVGMALFYGGMTQILAGMWEFRFGNTFTATAFGTYGSFWLSYAAIYIPWFGIEDAYSANAKNVGPALGIFLLGWALITFMLWVGTLRANVALVTLFTFLTLTFVLLSIAEFKGPHGLKTKRAGGFFGIFTSIIAWYVAIASLVTAENSYFVLPVGPLNKRR
jgi:succinate-acetate transporter protein